MVALVLGRIDLGVGHRLHHVGERLGERAKGCDGSLAGFAAARVHEHAHDHELAVHLLREERHRGRDHDVRDRGKLLGRGFGLGDEPVDRVGVRREDQHAADDRLDRMQAVVESRGDAEVAASSSDRPEEIGLRVGVDVAELAVRGHDVGCDEVVDRQAVLAHEVPDAAPERDPSDPHRPAVAEPDHETVLVRRGCDLARRKPRLGPGGATLDVDVERAHVLEVEHDAVVPDAVARDAVAAAPNGEPGTGVAYERDDARNVGVVGDASDRGWATIHAAVEEGARPVVVGISGARSRGRGRPIGGRAAGAGWSTCAAR